MRAALFSLITLVASAGPLAAQTSPVPTVRPPATSAQASAQQRYEASLPARRAELEAAGVPDTTVTRVITTLREREVGPEESDRVLIATRDAARENGPTDNFGAFVQSQLAAGKRGQELAAAIRVEHQQHGHGPRGQGQGQPAGARGRSGAAGAPAHAPAAGGQGRGRKP